tara:strand:+ start:4125 stop:4349 length:225 start_codon:yes stop_codon:yes gene_type:complete
MLNKFQDQDLFSSVEKLENLKEDIDIIISSIKNMHPSLFNSPRVAKYNTPDGRYDPTPIINDDDNTIDGMDGEE